MTNEEHNKEQEALLLGRMLLQFGDANVQIAKLVSQMAIEQQNGGIGVIAGQDYGRVTLEGCDVEIQINVTFQDKDKINPHGTAVPGPSFLRTLPAGINLRS